MKAVLTRTACILLVLLLGLLMVGCIAPAQSEPGSTPPVVGGPPTDPTISPPAPAPPTEPEAERAEGWVGTLHRFPPGNQFGRYFERDDGQRFDVGSPDITIREQIATLVDTDTRVRMWGMFFPAVSAGNPEPVVGHIAIERLEIITALGTDEPATPDEREIVLYWVGEDDQLVAEQRRIPRTPAIGRATLEALLQGPQQPGLTTAIPTPAEVQQYPGREADWGDRVRLLGLTIEDGVATANFSQELRAYGGGSLRVQLIRQQITQTLQQFPTVQEVRIAIDGDTEGVLEP